MWGTINPYHPHEGVALMTLPEFKQIVDEAKKEIQEIDVAELQRMQDDGANFSLIDVREAEEQARGAIPGAVGIPRGVLELKIDEVTTDKDKPIVSTAAVGAGRRWRRRV